MNKYQRLLEEYDGTTETAAKVALASIATNFEYLTQWMEESRCNHGTVTLFNPCRECTLRDQVNNGGPR